MEVVVKETNLVLKIRLGSGASKARLQRALERLGGPYRVLRGPQPAGRTPHPRRESKNPPPASDWVYYGPEEAYWGGRVKEIAINGSKPHLRDAGGWRQRLEASGLKVKPPGRSAEPAAGAAYLRRYAVSVLHLRALETRLLGHAGQSLPLPGNRPASDSPLWKRLESTAVRALYALGLDMGEVIISAGEEGKFTVDSLSLSPEIGSDAAAERYARALREIMAEQERLLEAPMDRLIGMDPEFLLFDRDTGKVIPASRYLPFHGVAGCDVLRYRGQRLFPLAELRPKPGKEPREVVVHLLRALREAGHAIENRELIWQAGAMPQRGFPLGGHLHFSGVLLTPELLRTLDNYLALPLSVLEDGRGAHRRPRYGFLGDFRRKEYGGFEYRTLPSFLVSPTVTKGVVALARLITENEGELTARPLEREEIFAAFYAGKKKPLQAVLPRLFADIQAASAYPRYESYIAPLLTAALSGRTWDETADIRRAWKMQNPS
ncbi:putative amidoligase domain-containing protein [Paenibacillus macerans]|uniref:putative amidoligase domain-containing protein n=1 Tax=Paenibacillus macerans TaxID=44252 RepID=UPI003D31E4B3